MTSLGSQGQRRGHMLNLDRSEVISSLKKMDRQGLREISVGEEVEEEEEDPLPVYNPQGESEDDTAVTDTDTDTAPYYETGPDSEEAVVQYPVTLK